ncbi:TonB-dependent receptor domain-containing protein [Sphingomonas lycopersici]|uniref:TonB-dependent receptor domain-containing protein n=1 Tax=Sphingomonas lycopersici TaxID=2951807 RepID=UPI002238138C|nr:TonB-dependent receptor [Sphingomonas lycopersici]
MSNKINLKSSVSRSFAFIGLLALATGAHAQTAPTDSTASSAPGAVNEDAPRNQDIIVTGTLIRGIAPTGTNVIGVDRTQIQATGVSSSTDLLAKIPQLSYFGTAPRANQDAGSPINYPNLRNLNATGGATTLFLMNGHRLVGQGILSSIPDPTIIPPAVIERVDVIPDGGSSIYGSDAIGGVINFITRKRFNGIEAGGHYGLGDHYRQANGDVTAGKDWASGSAFVSYSYAWHDNLLGQYRDYATSNHLAQGGSDLRSTSCAPGNITIGTTTYALPGRVAGTLNRCDDPKVTDIYPRETRQTVFASFDQQLSPSLEFTATAYWSRRDTEVRTPQSAGSGTITALNPYFRAIGTERSHNVSFSYASVFGPSNVTNQHFQSYGVTPALNWKIGAGWEIRAQANFGRSYSEIHEDTVNSAAASLALAGTSIATALNPYDLAATNPAVLAAIENFENHSIGVQELAEGRIVADGRLFALPGGDIRIAVGGEYHYADLRQTMISAARGTTTGGTRSFSDRDVKSVFAELVVPLFGTGNGTAGLRSLILSGSVRHDEYSDVGGTTNPKIGVTWAPFDGLTVRGNWGTSFHAPGLESLNETSNQVQVIPFSPYRRADSSPLDLLRPTILLAGGNANLKPETATTWSVGFDLKPLQVPGLRLSATYYKTDFRNSIGLLSAATLFTDPNYAPFYTINPTLAQARAAAGSYPIVGVPNLALLYVGTSPYLLADARLQNFGGIRLDGIDFHASFTRQVGGTAAVFADVAGTWTLDRKFATSAGGPWTDTLKNGTNHLSFAASAGAKVGGLTGRVTYNYRGGYPILGLINQDYVKSLQITDLYVGYELPARGPLANTTLTLNVQNLFDANPPYANVAGNSLAAVGGATLGRLFLLGIRKTL